VYKSVLLESSHVRLKVNRVLSMSVQFLSERTFRINTAHFFNILLYIWKLGVLILPMFYNIVAHDKHNDEY